MPPAVVALAPSAPPIPQHRGTVNSSFSPGKEALSPLQGLGPLGSPPTASQDRSPVVSAPTVGGGQGPLPLSLP